MVCKTVGLAYGGQVTREYFDEGSTPYPHIALWLQRRH